MKETFKTFGDLLIDAVITIIVAMIALNVIGSLIVTIVLSRLPI